MNDFSEDFITPTCEKSFELEEWLKRKYQFPPEIRNSIIAHFPPKEAKQVDLVNDYLARAEVRISQYLSLDIRQPGPIPEYKDRLEKIAALSERLFSEIDRLPKGAFEKLAGSMIELSYGDTPAGYRPQKWPYNEKPNILDFDFYRFYSDFMWQLDVIRASANKDLVKLQNKKLKPNKDRKFVRCLVGDLINDYWCIFGKWPPTTKDQNRSFRLVLSVDIAKAIDFEIGPDLFEEMLKKHKKMLRIDKTN